jgi:ubiquinone/menaquinone biosynthesis C-methylase UbiE
MPAAYDKYDYPSYWIGREYEHGSEVIVIEEYLNLIPKINKTLDIGAGFGRLTSSYIYRSKKVILSDPSSKLLKIARDEYPEKKVKFIHSGVENLRKILKPKSIDLVIMVRVLHHIENPSSAFRIVNRILNNKGYFILEFANKTHFKASALEFIKGNFTFILDIFPKDRCVNKRKKTLPFLNYHPDIIIELLEKEGFKIIRKRSVSNIRSSLIKKIFTTEMCLFFEKHFQKILSYINFGPSIFILAQKKG